MMSFPSPQANQYRARLMRDILTDAESEGVELNSFEEFEVYRDAWVERHILAPESPRFNLFWTLGRFRGLTSKGQAMFNGFSKKVWREMQEER